MIWEKSSSLNCQEDNITSLENVHRWIVLSLAIVVPGQNVHRWIWQRCHVNVSMPRKFKHVHRWTYETKVVTSLGKNVQRWMWDAYGHMTETCSSLNLWDQNCHLATQKNSTLNGMVEIVQSHVCTEYSSEDYNMVQLLKGANDIINNNP